MLGPIAFLVVLSTFSSTADAPEPGVVSRTSPSSTSAPDSDWIVEEADNICGLSDPRALSEPAKVDYGQVWDATPEIKKLKRDGIDPQSPAGISLQQKATDRIREACDDVREAEGHCSVWKKIRHKDGRKIADITKEVEKKFPASSGL